MASDTQATETDGTSFDVDKIWVHGGILFGYSGCLSIREPLALSIEQKLKQPDAADRWETRAFLCAAAKPVLDSAYANFVPCVPSDNIRKLAGSLLAIGCDDDAHWLLEADYNNTLTFYTDRGFHAIGSGSVAAQVANGLLGHYEARELSVWHLSLVAYRTVKTCIAVLGGAHGVGGSVRLWQGEQGKSFRMIDDHELKAVEEGVREWEMIERETLGDVPHPGKTPEPADVPTMPKQLQNDSS